MSKQSILRALPLLALVVAILFTGFTPAWSDENKKKREHFEESEDHESGSRKWFVFKSKNSL
ncbi:MAG: hypothetical protein OEW39_13070, partial [Deltaproteobacteria bacterium]|nr:hypothetical protein [Deltaproteobacteria bacterium]